MESGPSYSGDLYVLQLLQECRREIKSCDDPEETVQANAALMNVIREIAVMCARQELEEELAQAGTLSETQDCTEVSMADSQSRTNHLAVAPPPGAVQRLQSGISDTAVLSASHTSSMMMHHHSSHIGKLLSHSTSEHNEPHDDEHLAIAECTLCGMDGVKGYFFKRGFKCQRCIGNASVLTAPPSSRYASRDHPYASRIRSDTRKAFVFPDAPTGLSDPSAVYSVTYVDYSADEDLLTDAADIKEAADCRCQLLAKLRLFAHPCFLYLYACGDDKRKKRCFFVHEAATPVLQSSFYLASDDGPPESPMRRCDSADSAMRTPLDLSSTSSARNMMHCAATSDRTASSFDDGNAAASLTAFSTKRVESDGQLCDDSSAGDAAASSRTSPSLVGASRAHAVSLQHVEWVRKVAYSVLLALEILHDSQLCHGAVTPANIFVDDTGNVKLRCAMVLAADWRRLVGPEYTHFLPPEGIAAADPTSPPPLLHQAADLYMLGATLASLLCSDARPAGSPPLTPAALLQGAHHSITASLDATDRATLLPFIKFLEALLHTDPSKRITATKALTHDVFTSVRVVNGVPAEKMGVTINVLDDVTATTPVKSSEATPPMPSAGTPERPRRTVSWKAQPLEDRRLSPQSPGPASPSLEPNSGRDMMFVSRLPPHASSQQEAMRGGRELSEFLRLHGPKFQIVQSSKISITLYSVRSDPRRRRGQSIASGPPQLLSIPSNN